MPYTLLNASATLLALMEHFETADELAYADLDELTTFITKAGRGRFAGPESTAKAVQAAAVRRFDSEFRRYYDLKYKGHPLHHPALQGEV